MIDVQPNHTQALLGESNRFTAHAGAEHNSGVGQDLVLDDNLFFPGLKAPFKDFCGILRCSIAVHAFIVDANESYEFLCGYQGRQKAVHDLSEREQQTSDPGGNAGEVDVIYKPRRRMLRRLSCVGKA